MSSLKYHQKKKVKLKIILYIPCFAYCFAEDLDVILVLLIVAGFFGAWSLITGAVMFCCQNKQSGWLWGSILVTCSTLLAGKIQKTLILRLSENNVLDSRRRKPITDYEFVFFFFMVMDYKSSLFETEGGLKWRVV